MPIYTQNIHIYVQLLQPFCYILANNDLHVQQYTACILTCYVDYVFTIFCVGYFRIYGQNHLVISRRND